MTTPATKKTTAATDSAATNPKGKTLAPRVDVGESADEFVIVANIPGSSLDDIDISFEAHKMHLLAKVV
ncbi:MAG: HSP20 family molecular chaperone IbpA, partial [Planctomycetota bacterium]